MKKNFIIFFTLLLSCSVFSQKIIDKPKTGFTTAPYLSIQKIEITDSTTVVSFEIANEAGFKFSIPKKTYIKDAAGEEKLFIKTSEGVPVGKGSKVPESGVLNYKLIFGKLDQSVTKLDFGEDGGDWFIYDIALQDTPNQSGIDKELAGNWYNSETGDWEIGFYDANVVYKNQVWKYDVIALKKGKGTIILSNKNQKITLFVKKEKGGTYAFGENPKSLLNYSNTIANLVTKSTINDEPYELPILKNDSATYCGYLKNYTPRANIKTIAIHIDNIITGNQDTYIAKVDENGFFSTKLPLYYPHQVWVRSPAFNASVFLEPGKTLFQLLGDEKSLFAGESAKINSDLLLFNPRWFNYEEVSSKILDMKPMDFIAFCNNLAHKEMDKLETLKKANAIGNKAYQVKKLDIQYGNYVHISDYTSSFASAYRNKNKIPREQRTLDIKIDTLGVDYYKLITDEVVNNPLAVLSNYYEDFINRLAYSDLFRPKSTANSFFQTADELIKSGYSLTTDEQQLLVDMKEAEAFQNRPAQKEFEKKYGEISSAFIMKHQKIIKQIAKDGIYKASDLEAYLVKNNIPITKEEKEYLIAEKKLTKETSPEKVAHNLVTYKNLKAFYEKHQTRLTNFYNEKRANFRNEKLAQLFDVKAGFATDVMTTQGICNAVVSQLTPLSDEDLIRTQQSIQTPFIADYVRICNEQTLAKIAANKTKTGYVINIVPKTEGDELFAKIMKKYEGKVVYVDFWATWCGPCRSGIEQIKPLKEELKDKDVVFVYLTDQTSPEKTYSAMIPDIKGEHYRLSTDEWNYLAGKFNISGIPHYVLVGKNGEVVNPKLGFNSNETIKKILQEQMK